MVVNKKNWSPDPVKRPIGIQGFVPILVDAGISPANTVNPPV